MKFLIAILLATLCHGHTPINKQSWVHFRKVKEPTYETAPANGEPNIIHAKHILIEERISPLSVLVQKSLRAFQEQMKKYAADVATRVKQATQATGDYGFVRKPEIRHQYRMLFNHHGQVIFGLKNMDLFLSIYLPKVKDIAHVQPLFLEYDNWTAPHRTNQNQHVYYSTIGFGRNNHGLMTELNSNTSEFLMEAIHIMVCNQYKHK